MKTKKRKINPYKVLRLVGILCAVVFMCYCTYTGVLFSEEPQAITVEESRQLRIRQLKEIAEQKERQEIAAQYHAQEEAKYEAWLLERKKEYDAQREAEYQNFIQHRRDPHGPVTIAE